MFSALVIDAAETSVPKFAPKGVKSYPPHIINLIHSRRVLRKDIKKADLSNKGLLVTQYNNLTKLFKQSVKEYSLKKWFHFLNKFGPHPVSSSQFWQIINKTRSQKNSSSIPILTVDGKNFELDKDKADLFASYLGEMFTLDFFGFCSDFHVKIEKFILDYDFEDCDFQEINLEEITNVIKKLKINSAPGEDGIHNWSLKHLSSNGLKLLLKLNNLSLSAGLPDAWKYATITMIPKKDFMTSNHTEYRPISLLSCVGKLAERVVRNRLYFYLESNNLIINQQSGFRSGRGTADNLLFITQKIREATNRNKKICGVFFDISKAFDKVWLAGLVYKLVHLGVPKYLIRFIKSFLEYRFFPSQS